MRTASIQMTEEQMREAEQHYKQIEETNAAENDGEDASASQEESKDSPARQVTEEMKGLAADDGEED